ncbi:MAG: ATPase [Candidatus Saccharibacteria bacterium]|nr:ATPase [Candidatus Saccharibacteria bacterium]
MLGRNFIVSPDILEVVTERTINSSAAKLFKDYTDPLLIPRWWGEESVQTAVEVQNLQEGGSWRYIQTEPNNTSYAWSGIYQEFTKPSKIVSTFVLEPQPGHVYIGTALFNELPNGMTQLVEKLKFLNVEDLNQMISMGMEQKTAERMDRLAFVVEN